MIFSIIIYTIYFGGVAPTNLFFYYQNPYQSKGKVSPRGFLTL